MADREHKRRKGHRESSVDHHRNRSPRNRGINKRSSSRNWGKHRKSSHRSKSKRRSKHGKKTSDEGSPGSTATGSEGSLKSHKREKRSEHTESKSSSKDGKAISRRKSSLKARRSFFGGRRKKKSSKGSRKSSRSRSRKGSSKHKRSSSKGSRKSSLKRRRSLFSGRKKKSIKHKRSSSKGSIKSSRSRHSRKSSAKHKRSSKGSSRSRSTGNRKGLLRRLSIGRRKSSTKRKRSSSKGSRKSSRSRHSKSSKKSSTKHKRSSSKGSRKSSRGRSTGNRKGLLGRLSIGRRKSSTKRKRSSSKGSRKSSRSRSRKGSSKHKRSSSKGSRKSSRSRSRGRRKSLTNLWGRLSFGSRKSSRKRGSSKSSAKRHKKGRRSKERRSLDRSTHSSRHKLEDEIGQTEDAQDKPGEESYSEHLTDYDEILFTQDKPSDESSPQPENFLTPSDESSPPSIEHKGSLHSPESLTDNRDSGGVAVLQTDNSEWESAVEESPSNAQDDSGDREEQTSSQDDAEKFKAPDIKIDSPAIGQQGSHTEIRIFENSREFTLPQSSEGIANEIFQRRRLSTDRGSKGSWQQQSVRTKYRESLSPNDIISMISSKDREGSKTGPLSTDGIANELIRRRRLSIDRDSKGSWQLSVSKKGSPKSLSVNENFISLISNKDGEGSKTESPSTDGVVNDYFRSRRLSIGQSTRDSKGSWQSRRPNVAFQRSPTTSSKDKEGNKTGLDEVIFSVKTLPDKYELGWEELIADNESMGHLDECKKTANLSAPENSAGFSGSILSSKGFEKDNEVSLLEHSKTKKDKISGQYSSESILNQEQRLFELSKSTPRGSIGSRTRSKKVYKLSTSSESISSSKDSEGRRKIEPSPCEESLLSRFKREEITDEELWHEADNDSAFESYPNHRKIMRHKSELDLTSPKSSEEGKNLISKASSLRLLLSKGLFDEKSKRSSQSHQSSSKKSEDKGKIKDPMLCLDDIQKNSKGELYRYKLTLPRSYNKGPFSALKNFFTHVVMDEDEIDTKGTFSLDTSLKSPHTTKQHSEEESKDGGEESPSEHEKHMPKRSKRKDDGSDKLSTDKCNQRRRYSELHERHRKHKKKSRKSRSTPAPHRISSGASCDICLEGSPSAYCPMCDHYMCIDCALSHQRLKRLFPGHKLERINISGNIAALTRSVGRKMCMEHAQHTNMYCYDCNQLICLYCSMRDHKTHHHEFVKVAAPGIKERLIKQLEPLKEMQTELTKAFKNIKNAKITLDGKKADVIEHIEESFDELHEILEQQEVEIIKDAETNVSKRLQILNSQELSLFSAYVIIKSVINGTEKCVELSGDADIMMMHVDLQQHIDREIEKQSLWRQWQLESQVNRKCEAAHDEKSHLSADSIFRNPKDILSDELYKPKRSSISKKCD